MSKKTILRDPPAFQEYAADMLAHERYQLLSLEKRGLLDTLRRLCWVNQGFPKELSRLAQLTGTPEETLKQLLDDDVLQFFAKENHHPSRYYCPELKGQRDELERRRNERSRSGKKGAAARWTDSNQMAEPSHRVTPSPEKREKEFNTEQLSKKEQTVNEDKNDKTLKPHQPWIDEYTQTENQGD